MKTLSAGIIGIFALGLALGNLVSGSGAVPERIDSELETSVESAPLVSRVDCGDGREALLEPIEVDQTTSFKVRCIAIEPEAQPAPPTPVEARPASSPEPAPVVVGHPPRTDREPPELVASDVVVDEDHGDARTWKQSAVVIGGAAGAGAGIGAIAKGKKGAAVGAAIGAASGAAYELIKKDKSP